MAESDPHEHAHIRTVKLRLAIDADDEPQARAIAAEVIRAMDVVAAGELEVTRSPSRQPFWNIVTDLDLSAAGNIQPDDALTRFRYVIRHLPGVTFISPRGDDGPAMLYQWLPDEWGTSMHHEQVVHPAVRAAGVLVTTNTGADPD